MPPDLSELAGNLTVPLELWTQALRVPVDCPHPTSVFQVLSLQQLGPTDQKHDFIRVDGLFQVSEHVSFLQLSAITIGSLVRVYFSFLLCCVQSISPDMFERRAIQAR